MDATDPSAEPPPRSVWTVLAWVLAGGAILLAWVFPDALSRLRASTEAYAAMDPSCALADGPCSASFPDGQVVTLAVDPPHAPTAVPLTFTVSLNGGGPAPTRLEILGIDMYMGVTSVPLSASEEGFEGTGTLPLCTTERMRWRVDALFPDRVAGFDLVSTRP